jgi:molybdopterin synthase sulfur carrier subunit
MTAPEQEITISIQLFSVYQEAFGTSEISYRFPPNTPVSAVLERAIAERPQLARWRDVTRFGIDLEFVDPQTILGDRNEVVLIPPVSGG